jgi:hypothetical protein
MSSDDDDSQKNAQGISSKDDADPIEKAGRER